MLTAIHIAQLLDTDQFWFRITEFIPQVFIGVLVVILGFIVADKAELIVSEYLRSVKLPEVAIIPKLVKYTVLYVAFLIALGQIGVYIQPLLILLLVYTAGVIIVGAIAFKDFLVSSAAGIYLLLNQPTASAMRFESATRRASSRRSIYSSRKSKTTARSTSFLIAGCSMTRSLAFVSNTASDGE